MATFESRHSFLIRGTEAFLRLEVGLNRGRVSAHEKGDDGAVVGEDFPLIEPTWANQRSGIWSLPGR
jgi:hypothetical protein